MLPILIFGRPNVGKSTLLNRFVGKKVAIVEDFPGVTRDWQEYSVVFQGVSLKIFDTPGLCTLPIHGFVDAMWHSVEKLVSQCRLVLFMLDGQSGLTSDDYYLAKWLRRQKSSVLVVINKCEKQDIIFSQGTFSEAESLGFGSPVGISAQHGVGFSDLVQVLSSYSKDAFLEKENGGGQEGPDLKSTEDFKESVEQYDVPKVAILGRPNTGKSTFINACLGYERLLTDAQAGTTRDSVSLDYVRGKRVYRIFDTAGLRKQRLVRSSLEKMSCSETFRSLVFCQVVLLFLDITRGIEKQDLTIIEKVVQEGRGLVIILNKWDLCEHPHEMLKDIRRCLEKNFSCLVNVPIVPVSALKGDGIQMVWKAVDTVLERWKARVPTAPLNRWLREKLHAHNLPLAGRTRIKVKYISQVKSNPPTFSLFGNQLSHLPMSYQRYLMNGLIQDFDMAGTSLRLLLRSSENPYKV